MGLYSCYAPNRRIVACDCVRAREPMCRTIDWRFVAMHTLEWLCICETSTRTKKHATLSRTHWLRENVDVFYTKYWLCMRASCVASSRLRERDKYHESIKWSRTYLNNLVFRNILYDILMSIRSSTRLVRSLAMALEGVHWVKHFNFFNWPSVIVWFRQKKNKYNFVKLEKNKGEQNPASAVVVHALECLRVQIR